MNLISKTGGGKQFWADVWFFHDWRIQRHALTGHYRLLDGNESPARLGHVRRVPREARRNPQSRQATRRWKAKPSSCCTACFARGRRWPDCARRSPRAGGYTIVLPGLSDDSRQRGRSCPIARQRRPQPGRHHRNQLRRPQPGQPRRAALAAQTWPTESARCRRARRSAGW